MGINICDLCRYTYMDLDLLIIMRDMRKSKTPQIYMLQKNKEIEI